MPESPRAVLIGIDYPGNSEWSSRDSIEECIELAKTAGIQVVQTMIQRREKPANPTYLGSGKLDELSEAMAAHAIDLILTDDDLHPNQHRYLESRFQKKVVDRSGLILDIFAARAHTYEAKLQVELAQLDYLLPRLTGLWTHLSRQSGGIGTRGPGEKQLEVDKRQIRSRIALLKKDIERVRLHRSITREKRLTTPIPVAALIGYTNAGKSTLMHALSQADVLIENKLFATLDTTTRQIILPNNEHILLSDTVGFIQKLPHQLVSAFKSTLEELQYADLLLHVVDASDPKAGEKIAVTENLLRELQLTHLPLVRVFNKIDRLSADALKKAMKRCESNHPSAAISASTRLNIAQLFEKIQEGLSQNHTLQTFHVPYQRMDIVNLIHKKGKVLSETYDNDIVILKTDINKIISDKILGMLSQ